jgi:hypothetical protein
MRIQTDATDAPHFTFTSTTQRRLLHLLRGVCTAANFRYSRGAPLPAGHLFIAVINQKRFQNGVHRLAPPLRHRLLLAATSDTASSSAAARQGSNQITSTQTPHRNRRLREPSRRRLQHVKSNRRCSFDCLQLKSCLCLWPACASKVILRFIFTVIVARIPTTNRHALFHLLQSSSPAIDLSISACTPACAPSPALSPASTRFNIVRTRPAHYQAIVVGPGKTITIYS